MTLLPTNPAALTDDQYNRLTNDFACLLEDMYKQHDVAYIDPGSPDRTWITVNSHDQLIAASIFLGSHDMLFSGHYDISPDKELELQIYTYFTMGTGPRTKLDEDVYQYVQHMPLCSQTEGWEVTTIVASTLEAYIDAILCLAGHGFIFNVASVEYVDNDQYQIDIIGRA